jgi:very-short-patch-repair endonuclease
MDDVTGGSGLIDVLAERFADVAKAALEHLTDHDCDGACYRCLRTYRNARYSHHLDWRTAMGFLRNAAVLGSLVAAGVERDADDDQLVAYAEAAAEGCGSPAELRLLRALRENGVPEPEKQFAITRANGTLLSVADFAWPSARLLVYVDGLRYHSSRARREFDSRQTRELQSMGWTVMRFMGTELWRRLDACVAEIGTASNAGLTLKSV